MKYNTIIKLLFKLNINKIIIIIILNLLSIINCQYGPNSPCPNVLSYQQNGGFYGIIKVDNYYTNNENVLTVRTTSNNRFSNPSLQLTQDQNSIFSALERKSPIYYKLITEDGYAPNVLDIISNGATICTSTEYPLTSIFTVTHRLTLQSDVRNPFQQFTPRPVTNPFTEAFNNNFQQNSLNNELFTNILVNGIPVSQFSPTQINGIRFTENQGILPSQSNINPLFYESSNINQNPSFPVSSNINQNPSRQQSIKIIPTRRAASIPSNHNPIFSESSDNCGTTTLRVPLIFNGQIFQEGSWPWLTVLFRRSTKSFDCGGSLISHASVITAAHCFVNEPNESDYIMGIGVYDLNQRSEEGATFENIKNIRIHPQYSSTSTESYNDIAIVTLQRNIEYNRRIKPICLWSTTTNFNQIDNKIAIVAGWGLTDPKGSPTSETPTYITAKVVSYIDCIVSNPAFGQVASNTTLCAGFRNGTGPCRGDSGNGLMVEENGKWYLTGIVSQSLFDQNKVCKLDDYVVYTDVLKVVNWIKRYMTE